VGRDKTAVSWLLFPSARLDEAKVGVRQAPSGLWPEPSAPLVPECRLRICWAQQPWLGLQPPRMVSSPCWPSWQREAKWNFPTWGHAVPLPAFGRLILWAFSQPTPLLGASPW